MAGLHVPEEGRGRPEAPGAQLALGAVPDQVIPGVRGQLLLGLEGQAALAAPVLVHVLFGNNWWW